MIDLFLNKALVGVEFDFFADQQRALAEIEKYLNSQGPAFREAHTATLTMLRNSKKPPGDEIEVPILYLQALYHNKLADPNTSVISSSFYTYASGFETIPSSYFSASPVPLLSAVLDRNGDIEDEISQYVEPMQSFYRVKQVRGVVLVGAEESRGVYFGTRSKGGDGVSCLGPGSVVGRNGACSGVRVKGTSFATPNIGVDLFLAKAFWKSRGLGISAIEARTRLLLASDINPQYVGLYASGGIPRLERLLLGSGTYAVSASDSAVRKIDLDIGNSFIQYDDPEGGPPIVLKFRRGPSFYCGLQIVDNQVFVFSEGVMKWVKVHAPSLKLSIAIRNGDGALSTLTTVKEFSNHYKEIIIL